LECLAFLFQKVDIAINLGKEGSPRRTQSACGSISILHHNSPPDENPT